MVALEHAAKTSQPAPPVLSDTTNVDHYGQKRLSEELTAANFQQFIAGHDAVLVNFHAPWWCVAASCVYSHRAHALTGMRRVRSPHCRAFAPVWEHAADLVLQHMAEEHSRRTDARQRIARVALGAVDCTQHESAPLCKEQHIQAFPTVRVYRAGSAGTVFDDLTHSHYESYTGPRVAQDIAAFAAKVAHEVITRAGQVSGADVQPGGYTLGWQPPGTDHDSDGVKESKVLPRGCVIEGTVRMARVPGELHIVPTGMGHSLHMENVNLSHTIDHLSFGTVRS